jgi:hypothetical protein
MIRASVFVLFFVMCCVLVAEMGGWELIPTPKRKLETWWRILSDCASSTSEEQLTELSGRIRKGEWWFGEQGSGPVDQTGVVVLGDGQKVSFCFLSHHSIYGFIYDLEYGLDSLALFRVEDLEVRTVGWCFCCEVMFLDTAQPKDLIDFVRLLAKCGRVEIVKRKATTP